jgi:serine/threonine protein kinase
VLSQAANPQTLAAFQREAETVAHLEHPNILPVYGYGQAAGRPYLIVRYLGGGTVAARLRKAPIDLQTAAHWVRAVCSALDFAHGRGLVHRDVKPSNILLDQAGNAYLTDFGITTLAAAGGDLATGSAAYMSPEQAAGGSADRRSDLYSLAVSLFEMLTGQQPYTAETPLGVIVRHINDPIPSARALNPTIPPAVDALIQRGMAKSPADRPQSALEFAQLLASAMAGQDSPPLAPARTSPAAVQNVQRAPTPAPAAEPIPARPGQTR